MKRAMVGLNSRASMLMSGSSLETSVFQLMALSQSIIQQHPEGSLHRGIR